MGFFQGFLAILYLCGFGSKPFASFSAVKRLRGYVGVSSLRNPEIS